MEENVTLQQNLRDLKTKYVKNVLTILKKVAQSHIYSQIICLGKKKPHSLVQKIKESL